MYEFASPLFVQCVQMVTDWNGFYVYSSLVWTRRLPEGIMVVHQLPPSSEVVQFGDGHGMWWVPFHFFFFFWLWRFEFPSLQLLPCGGMACVEGSLVPAKLFSFPRFLKRFLFKLLVFSFHSYFCEILAILCFSMPSFQLPLDFTAAISTLTSSPFQFRFLFQVPLFTFLAFFFSFLTSLFCALFPFWNLAFFASFLWTILVLGALPP